MKTDPVRAALLPCPFCGGKPEIEDEPHWRISCEDDACSGVAITRGFSFKDAARDWNTRVTPPREEVAGEAVARVRDRLLQMADNIGGMHAPELEALAAALSPTELHEGGNKR